ncbi:MAG: tRNA preQ1(34) S-adenosylmethionine ribosyltransferase-isomerase QueA [Gammaproteobacteria bacterium]|nr:tRNA preQ1(34) S-adenosylmethionine ribosyltransferase-isomerase QueA [Gammaproteobacteria bacterium]
MRKSDFHFDLPAGLIAQEPPAQRGASRLLFLDRDAGTVRDQVFADLPQLLRSGDLLVVNDTRVVPARLHGVKDSGGRIELLVERVLDERRFLAQCRSSKPLRMRQSLHLDEGVVARMVGREADFCELEIESGGTVHDVLDRIGHVPLPPYIRRGDRPSDRERYQTVYARRPGAVAAPTAGLHFDTGMIGRLGALGVEVVAVTLHVGAGTFQPVRVDDLRAHRMHRERFEIGAQAAERINAARSEHRRVIAVGTTVVRALESASRGRDAPAGSADAVAPCSGETDIFIYPGHRFRAIDGLITNFHLPGSTLLMLVCAFAGTGRVLAAYRHAVGQGYRFFSYGDAMFIASMS